MYSVAEAFRLNQKRAILMTQTASHTKFEVTNIRIERADQFSKMTLHHVE